MEFGCKIQHGGQGIAIWCGDGVEAAIIAAGPPRPILLGYHLKWRDQGELDRRTIPAASSERNSASAIFSLSGSRRRALANTGSLLFQQNGGHHGGAAECLCHRQQCWETTPGGSGPTEQCAKLMRQTLKRRRRCNRLVVGMMRTTRLLKTDLPTDDEQRENRYLGLAWKLRRE